MGPLIVMIRETDSNAIRATDLISTISNKKTMEKPNKNKTMPPNGRLNINLKNPSSSGANFRNSGKNEQFYLI